MLKVEGRCDRSGSGQRNRRFFTGAVWTAALSLLLCSTSLADLRDASVAEEYRALGQQLNARHGADATNRLGQARVAAEVFRREALLVDSDRDPLDVVLRRTEALLGDIRLKPGAPTLTAEAQGLSELKQACSSIAITDTHKRTALFEQVCRVRRAIAFKNPLLDFERIIFLKRNKQARGEIHMVDQFLGFNQAKTGGVYVLEKPFSEKPIVRSLLRPVEHGRLKGRHLENSGAFIGLDVNYDGRSILFAFTETEGGVPAGASFENQYCTPAELPRSGQKHYYWRPESTFHIFRANADGSGLTQLTDGPWNDYDPCFLPNGRVAFVSERNCGQCRCGARPLPAAVLHAMMDDGSDIIRLSWHDTNEWEPSVNHDGMLVYTRWDYVDRDSDAAHHLWTCFPDGRDPRSPHGNYPQRRESRPWMEMSIRAIPNSHRYVAVAAPHHGEAYGSLVLIDVRQADDGGSGQLRRLTPEVPFPEAESAPGVPNAKGTHKPKAEVYGTPWPLSEDYFLCVYDSGQRNYGLYLLDSFGNRELLYRDPAIACLDPMPLQARPRPTIISPGTLQAKADQPRATKAEKHAEIGTVAVMNVYESAQSWPANTKIRELRVVSLFAKDNHLQDSPNIGHALQSLARGVLGTAPVEEDGSAFFEVPAGTPVYFQALDEHGLAVQTMRSDTYLHPGERLTCVGCHESRSTPLSQYTGRQPLALRRPPSQLRPEPTGSYPLTFPRLVQPVLDAQCVKCHDEHEKKPASLHGDRFVKAGWSESFNHLRQFAWGMAGGNGVALRQPQYSTPGDVGARASKLYALLAAGHYEVKLTTEELRRITVWLDCNSNFYGAYHDPIRQARGEIVAPKWGVPPWTPFEMIVR